MKYEGRSRHRVLKRLFRKPILVLQWGVERRYASTEVGESNDVIVWVDVRPEWLLETNCGITT